MNIKVLVLLVICGLTTAPTVVGADIQTKLIEYKVDGVIMTGYLAFDAAIKSKRPGILVVHEWWGHDEYVRNRAKMLAKQGYTAFALDMYGDGKKAHHPKDAAKFSGQVMAKIKVAEARFTAALKILQDHPSTAANKIAAIGYCFGGSIVQEMARRGVELAAVASFHGSMKIITIPKPGVVKTKFLILNGKEDPFSTKKQIDNFKKVMNKSKISYEFINYDGAKHSFTNPEADKYGKKFAIPLAYNETADKASWSKMLQLFDSVF